MKQSRTTSAAFDLDDLERELQKAAAPKQAAKADDPLAELARIVGDDLRPARSEAAPPSSFEDFLASAAPEPVKRPTPAFEPLFPEGLPQAEARIASPPAVKEKAYVDPLEALLSQDLGLRSGLDEMPEPPEPLKPSASAQDEPAAETSEATSADPIIDAIGAAEPPPAPEMIPANDGGDAALAAIAGMEPAPFAPEPPAKVAPFDDMIAEFEAAIRDTAGESVRAEMPAAAPMITPPPGNIVLPPPPNVLAPEPAPEAPSSAGIGLGSGAAAIGAGAVAATIARPRRGIMLAGGAIAIAVIGLGALAIFGGSRSPKTPTGAVPVIEAKAGAGKERPANPGGVEVPNQDKEILQTRASEPPRQERVQPREEQPVDLNQAQRQATATPAAQVRQIPGVGTAVPAPTAPEAGSPTEALPRPVASVPIVISGQPASPAPTAPPAVAIAPPAVPAAPASAANQTAAAPPAAVLPVPVATQPAAQRQQAAGAPVNAQQPTSEPRRVRTVPIRPDNGESAPQRAQSQPRVVAATPATPADPNAPLPITPQASRAQASRAQAAAPAAPAVPRQAAASPGNVPSSVPSLEQPSSPAEPQRTASTGSGFAVQLAAEGSEDAARAKYNRMRGQYGSVLGDTTASIRSAEVNGRSVYRVRVGNMSREEAVSMCERLKASGGSCFVARN